MRGDPGQAPVAPQVSRLCGIYDYDHAAAHALIGLLDFPAVLDIPRCEAYLIEFPHAVCDRYGTGEFSHGVLLVARGSVGPYEQTMGIYAANPLGVLTSAPRWDGSQQWFPLVDPEALAVPGDPEEFLRRSILL